MNARQIGTRAALVLGGCLAAILLLELGALALSGVRTALREEPVPHHLWDPGFPELYRNNPARPDVDERGYRSCPTGGDPAEADATILFLGDSVTFGHGVACEQAFPHLLERRLEERTGRDLRAVNSGANGYTTYNQLGAWRRFAAQDSADLVVLVTGLNDLVNPRLHWSNRGELELAVPPAAIPNPAYDEEVAGPQLAAWRREASRSRLATWRALQQGRALLRALQHGGEVVRQHESVTGEVVFPITWLLDPGRPEWQWYEGLLDELHAGVREQGAELLVVFVPLAYQLEEGYPHQPQRVLEALCAQRGIRFLDMLPPLRALPAERAYLSPQGWHEDVWHLSTEGHAIVADELEAAVAPVLGGGG